MANSNQQQRAIETTHAELEDIIRNTVDQVLRSHRSVDEETHKAHHDFLQMLLEKESRRVARNERIKAQVYGWGIIGIISGIGTAVYKVFFERN